MSLLVDISKKLGNFKLDVSFEAGDGVTGLLGASGCGKSMTLRCIAGIDKPDRGRIELDGETLFDSERKINVPPQKRKAGYLFQNYALFPNMSVRRNILCGLNGEKDRQEKQNALQSIVGMMQLADLVKRKPHELSGGQQQRAALARILVGDPNILMLDEPFSALDSHLRGQLQIQMRKLLAQFGRTTLLVTHDRDEAYLLCDRIALMDDGRIIANKKTKELFGDPGSRQAALLTGCKNITAARKTGEYEVEAMAWGARFTTAMQVRDDIDAIGIRAHYFDAEIARNRLPVRFTGEIEEPFECILQFRYENQDETSPDVWWRVPKGNRPAVPPAALGVEPADVLPLYL